MLKFNPYHEKGINIMKTYQFTVSIVGTGENEEQAWRDAIEGFNADPGPTPE